MRYLRCGLEILAGIASFSVGVYLLNSGIHSASSDPEGYLPSVEAVLGIIAVLVGPVAVMARCMYGYGPWGPTYTSRPKT